MPHLAVVVATIVASYFLGDVLFAYVIGRYLYGVDVRQYGSHNLGGTNVQRTLGSRAAIMVIAGDVAKGTLAVLLGGWVSGGNDVVRLLCGIAVIAGHNWPVLLGFTGGKGIGTSLGVLVGLMPKAALVPAAVFVLTVWLTRYVSLGSVLAAAVFPPTVLLVYPGRRLFLAGSLILAIFAIYRHLPNIRRLLAGKEFKLGQKIDVPPAGGSPEQSKQEEPKA